MEASAIPKRSRIDWSFAERFEDAASLREVTACLMREIRSLGFSHAACASHVDPLRPPPGAVVLLDYPSDWVARYSERGYARRDPVFVTAKRQALPFQWSDRAFRRHLAPDQTRILQEAAEAGLNDGLTIPIHAPGAWPASCSLVIGRDGVDPLHLPRAHWLAVYAHERARRLAGAQREGGAARLSPRERQVLELIGQGKDDYAISAILGVSEHTAHNQIRRAMGKYGVSTRTQAVIRALHDGEIRLEDVAF